MVEPWQITVPRDAVAQSVGGTSWSVRPAAALPAELAALVAPPIVVQAAVAGSPVAGAVPRSAVPSRVLRQRSAAPR